MRHQAPDEKLNTSLSAQCPVRLMNMIQSIPCHLIGYNHLYEIFIESKSVQINDGLRLKSYLMTSRKLTSH